VLGRFVAAPLHWRSSLEVVSARKGPRGGSTRVERSYAAAVKATRLVLIAVGVVAVAALAKKWFVPGEVYAPEKS
jgi:hypothetical protein